MRKLTAKVSVEDLGEGASLLRIVAATGETLGVELDAERLAALHEATAPQPSAEPAPDTPAPPARTSRKKS